MKLTSIAAAIGFSLFCTNSIADIVTIHDVLDRDVKVDVPAKRVVLGFYAEDYMAIGTEKAFDHVVGLSVDTWKGWRPASWKLYTNYRPSLAQIPDVGEVEAKTFSIEKVLKLNPSVIVLADWQYKGLGSDAERLESFGIPIVVIDYNSQTLKRHLESTKIIGELTGQEARAEEIASDYKATFDMIQDRIKKANLPKPRTYIEFGNKGPEEYSFTYGKNMWGAMADTVSADNIAAPFVKWWGPMNPEQVIASKPEVIFIAGTETDSKSVAMPMGEGISRDQAIKHLKAYTQRAGWDTMPAVKNQRVYGLYQGASRTIMDAPMMVFMAQALYPNLFNDLTPEQDYLNFYKKYLPVTPVGTFTAAITE